MRHRKNTSDIVEGDSLSATRSVTVDRLPFVTVVVSFHNERQALGACIASLLAQTYPADRYEIILVNDGSTNDAESQVGGFLSDQRSVRLLRQGDLGPAAGRNLGIKNARGSIVAFTDPDCVADAGWLAEHVKHYSSEDVAGVEGRVETDWDEMLYPIRVAPAASRYVTCNISYRREVLERVGLFNESFRWKEDDELAYRVLGAGWRIVREDQAVVFHPVKRLSLLGLLSYGLKHRYDIPFYVRHEEVGKSYFQITKVGPLALTPEFFNTAGGLVAILLALLLFHVSYMLSMLLVSAIAVLLFLQRRRLLNRKSKYKYSVFWLSLYVGFIELGRLWGILQYRRFLL
jgi:GT2 family glycosyltransferase